MTKFGTNASGAIWWQNLQPIQVVPLKLILNYSGWNIELFWLKDLLKIWSQYPWSVVPLAMFYNIFYMSWIAIPTGKARTTPTYALSLWTMVMLCTIHFEKNNTLSQKPVQTVKNNTFYQKPNSAKAEPPSSTNCNKWDYGPTCCQCTAVLFTKKSVTCCKRRIVGSQIHF